MHLSIRNRFLLVGLVALTALVTTLVNQFAIGPAAADSDDHSTVEVRVTARQLADGRVEFAVQQRDGGVWGARLLPRPRLFPTNASVDRWLNSGSVELDAPIPPPAAMPLMCVIADGNPDTLFWQLLEFHTKRAANLIGVDLDYSTHPDVTDRVDAIGECVEHGAQMIIATLADADDVIPALHEAAEAGVKIATFGAGEEHADRAGSLIHVSYDETAAGHRATQQFQSLEVSGTVLCLGRAGNPQGRNGICDVVDDLVKDVEVVSRTLTADDWSGQIESVLEEYPNAAGLLVTEADLLSAAIEAMQHSNSSAILGSIGEYPLSRLSFEQRDRIAFMVMDFARVETLLPMAALHYMYSYHPNARFFEGSMGFNGQPNVHVGGPLGGHGRPTTHQQDDHGDDDRSHDE